MRVWAQSSPRVLPDYSSRMGDGQWVSTIRRHGRARCIAFAITLLAFPGLGWAEPDPSTEAAPAELPGNTGGDAALDAEIRAVLAQNRAARQAIDAYAMKITWERRAFPETPVEAPLPEGTVTSYGEGTWMEKGDKFRVHRMKRWEGDTPGPPPGTYGPSDPLDGKEYSSWSVYNGEYFAWHDLKLPGRIHLFPKKTIEAGIANPRGHLFPYPLEWGFGFGGGYVDTEYEKGLAHEIVRWELERFETADGPKIKLTRFINSTTRGYTIRTEFVLDLERDFLVVSTCTWGPPDTQKTESIFDLKQWPGGRWYPERATKRRRDEFHEYTFEDVRFNEPIDDEQFTVNSFDMDYRNIRLIRRDNRTSETPMLYRGGRWIPESQVPPRFRPAKPGKDEFVKLGGD